MLAGPVMARPVITSASASFAQLGKQEIPTASIATTSPGAAGAGEAPGTAPPDNACLRDPSFIPGKCSFNQRPVETARKAAQRLKSRHAEFTS